MQGQFNYKTYRLASSDCLTLGKGWLLDVRAVGFHVADILAEPHNGRAWTDHFTQNSVVVLQLVVLQLVVLQLVVLQLVVLQLVVLRVDILVVSPEHRQPYTLFSSSNPLL